MIDIEEYILKTKEERQQHLRLDEDCIVRGGQSMYLKGLVAHLRDTTIPSGKKIHVCHACHNAKCSNPNHLYWGTASENAHDRIADTGKTLWDYTVDKYGEEGARQLQRRKGNTNGAGNKGSLKTEEHKKNISIGLKKKKQSNINSGRKPAMDCAILLREVEEHGIRDAATRLGLTFYQCRDRYYRAKKKVYA